MKELSMSKQASKEVLISSSFENVWATRYFFDVETIWFKRISNVVIRASYMTILHSSIILLSEPGGFSFPLFVIFSNNELRMVLEKIMFQKWAPLPFLQAGKTDSVFIAREEAVFQFLFNCGKTWLIFVDETRHKDNRVSAKILQKLAIFWSSPILD